MASTSSEITSESPTTSTTGAMDIMEHGDIVDTPPNSSKTIRNEPQQCEGQKTLNLEEIEKLSYEIYRYSSFSTNYVPE